MRIKIIKKLQLEINGVWTYAEADSIIEISEDYLALIPTEAIEIYDETKTNVKASSKKGNEPKTIDEAPISPKEKIV